MFKKREKVNKVSNVSTKRYRVMLVCGSGIVSSTLVHPLVEDIMKDNGYKCQIIKGGFNDIKGTSNIDLILTTMGEFPREITELNIPIVVVTALFKGDTDAVAADINKALKKEQVDE
jgi:galactitol-specific phosphotransferase system IIB component